LNTHRGAALADGKLIRGTNDGFLLARGAKKKGNTLWAKQISDPKQGYFISMPPLVHGNLIYTGPAGAETAAQGWVGAFRISDGGQVWRFNIVPDDGEPGAETWEPAQTWRRQALDFDVLWRREKSALRARWKRGARSSGDHHSQFVQAASREHNQSSGFGTNIRFHAKTRARARPTIRATLLLTD
jgi:hypothetical protein